MRRKEQIKNIKKEINDFLEVCECCGGRSNEYLDEKTMEKAKYFIDLIPEDIPIPDDVSCTDEGDIILDWYNGKKCMSVDIIVNGMLFFHLSWEKKGLLCAEEKFNDTIPEEIIGYLRELCQIKSIE